MASMRDYFLAGLALEEANEKRDRARAELREACKRACPDELAKLDVASDGVAKAEARLAHTMQALVKGQANEVRAEMNQWAQQHAVTCDNPECEIKRAVQGMMASTGGKAN